MIKSESIQALAKALVTFHVKVDKVNKDSNNPFFKSKYASLSNILDVIDTPLNECGLSILQMPSGEHELTTILLHESGEYIGDTYRMTPTKNDPQGLGSAITYQRRYALGAILSLNIDEDDDGNEASKPSEKKPDDGKPWLNKDNPDFQRAIEHVKKGGAISKIEEKYKISKEVRELILKG